MIMEYPKLHQFPPFFTKQSNATVLENQLNAWADLILLYCRQHRIFRLLPHGAVLGKPPPSDPLFSNEEIGRSCSDDFRKEMLLYMIHKQQKAEYVDSRNANSGILIYWRSLSEWASILRNYLDQSGQLGSVLTVYELIELDETIDDLRGMDQALFLKVIDVLAKQGKAQVMGGDGVEGVKIV